MSHAGPSRSQPGSEVPYYETPDGRPVPYYEMDVNSGRTSLQSPQPYQSVAPTAQVTSPMNGRRPSLMRRMTNAMRGNRLSFNELKTLLQIQRQDLHEARRKQLIAECRLEAYEDDHLTGATRRWASRFQAMSEKHGYKAARKHFEPQPGLNLDESAFAGWVELYAAVVVCQEQVDFLIAQIRSTMQQIVDAGEQIPQ